MIVLTIPNSQRPFNTKAPCIKWKSFPGRTITHQLELPWASQLFVSLQTVYMRNKKLARLERETHPAGSPFYDGTVTLLAEKTSPYKLLETPSRVNLVKARQSEYARALLAWGKRLTFFLIYRLRSHLWARSISDRSGFYTSWMWTLAHFWYRYGIDPTWVASYCSRSYWDPA